MSNIDMHTIHLPTIDSTNTYAKNHAINFPKEEITCIWAEEQTAGRGRQNKTWISPQGINLYVTFYFQLSASTLHLTSIGQVLAISCASILLQHTFSPQIKWPNDIQLRGKKVAGILCETAFHSSLVDLFLGIGINVNMDKNLLEQIDQPATSLKEETERFWDKRILLEELQTQFMEDLELFKQEGFTPFHPLFDHLLAFKGQTISCFDGKQRWTGICHSISTDGRLNLLLPNHQMKTLCSGDILLET